MPIFMFKLFKKVQFLVPRFPPFQKAGYEPAVNIIRVPLMLGLVDSNTKGLVGLIGDLCTVSFTLHDLLRFCHLRNIFLAVFSTLLDRVIASNLQTIFNSIKVFRNSFLVGLANLSKYMSLNNLCSTTQNMCFLFVYKHFRFSEILFDWTG